MSYLNTPQSSPLELSQELKGLLQTASTVFSEYVERSSQPGAPAKHAWNNQDLCPSSSSSSSNKRDLWQDIERVLDGATNTWTDGFLYKLYAEPTPVGVLSECLLGLINNNAHVHGSSPIGTEIERVVGQELAKLAGFPEHQTAALTFPGGAYSNIHALMVARNLKFPEIKNKGVAGIKEAPVVFTSTHAHYSIEKAVVASGLGLDHLIHVATDQNGRMDPAELRRLVEREKANGRHPFFVNATMGTTVLGAVDPMDEVAQICQDHGLWMHVDGAWGGPLALFGTLAKPPQGADSFTINPHKLMGVPLQCAFLLVRKGMGAMKRALALDADYLFHSDNDLDVGDATLGCGRRPDALKLWLVWRYYGTQYFQNRVQRARTMALELAQKIRARAERSTRGHWRLLNEPQTICVCFWYIPHNASDKQTGDPEPWWDSVTRMICTKINSQGTMLVDFATVDDKLPAFIRIPLNSPHVTTRTLDSLLDLIEKALD